MSARVASHDALVIDERALRALMAAAFQVAGPLAGSLPTLVAHFAHVSGSFVDKSATGASPRDGASGAIIAASVGSLLMMVMMICCGGSQTFSRTFRL